MSPPLGSSVRAMLTRLILDVMPDHHDFRNFIEGIRPGIWHSVVLREDKRYNDVLRIINHAIATRWLDELLSALASEFPRRKEFQFLLEMHDQPPMSKELLLESIERDPDLLSLDVADQAENGKSFIKRVGGSFATWLGGVFLGDDTVRHILLGIAIILGLLFPPLLLLLVVRNKVTTETANQCCGILAVISVIAIPVGIVYAVKSHSASNEIDELTTRLSALTRVAEAAEKKVADIRNAYDAHDASVILVLDDPSELQGNQRQWDKARSTLSTTKAAIRELSNGPHTIGDMVLFIILSVVGVVDIIFCLCIYLSANVVLPDFSTRE